MKCGKKNRRVEPRRCDDLCRRKYLLKHRKNSALPHRSQQEVPPPLRLGVPRATATPVQSLAVTPTPQRHSPQGSNEENFSLHAGAVAVNTVTKDGQSVRGYEVRFVAATQLNEERPHAPSSPHDQPAACKYDFRGIRAVLDAFAAWYLLFSGRRGMDCRTQKAPRGKRSKRKQRRRCSAVRPGQNLAGIFFGGPIGEGANVILECKHATLQPG